MSKTGTYVVRDGKVVKISDAVPRLRPPVYFKPESVNGKLYEEFATREHPRGQWVGSKDEKRQRMKELSLAEVGRV